MGKCWHLQRPIRLLSLLLLYFFRKDLGARAAHGSSDRGSTNSESAIFRAVFGRTKRIFASQRPKLCFQRNVHTLYQHNSTSRHQQSPRGSFGRFRFVFFWCGGAVRGLRGKVAIGFGWSLPLRSASGIKPSGRFDGRKRRLCSNREVMPPVRIFFVDSGHCRAKSARNGRLLLPGAKSRTGRAKIVTIGDRSFVAFVSPIATRSPRTRVYCCISSPL